ncbi:MAG: hypothetical protein QE265_03505 [Rhodoferax sp.]|nr:hypothetical protein [Rhodoferax sp.]
MPFYRINRHVLLLRLWVATKLLSFMGPNYFLIKAQRVDGTLEWDGGRLDEGKYWRPVGIDGLINPDEEDAA